MTWFVPLSPPRCASLILYVRIQTSLSQEEQIASAWEKNSPLLGENSEAAKIFLFLGFKQWEWP